jgi:cytochrome c biogenesis protein
VEGQLTLMEGETAQDFTSGDKEKPLDFQAHLDRFQVLYYPDGTPREFRSDLTLTKPGKAPKQVVCRVNEPVTFGDYTFYQSSYGNVLRLEVKEGENSRIVEAPVGQTMLIPGGQTHFRVLEYQPDLVMPGGEQEKHLGPAARLVYWEEDGHPRLVMLLENHPELADRHQSGPFRFYLKGTKSFSVLQVKHDPGVWWVYAGFLLLLPGFYLAFLRPAERWALILEHNKSGAWEARLLGAAPRARETFQDRLARLRELLKKGGMA